MLVYALGRGLEYYDVQTVDQIVTQLRKSDGRFSALVAGIVESTPFEKSRTAVTIGGNQPSKSSEHLADAN